jgi:hypothetical protein
MGLFDFFKKNNESEAKEVNLRKLQCDAEKLEIIGNLLKIPVNERDLAWQNSFISNIDTAAFSESLPQVQFGPDGFPYFALRVNATFNPFEPYCIKKIKDAILLERGLGVVINPHPNNQSDWVFSYGDILNYHLSNEFYSKIDSANRPGLQNLGEESKVMISQPSEHYLPANTKKFLKNIMNKAGIGKPKVMMMDREVNGKIEHELIFNIFREDFSSEATLASIIKKMQWYLPRHYVISTISKKSELINHFHLL